MPNLFVLKFLLIFFAIIVPKRADYLRRGLLVIPGLGRADRLTTVVHNLAILRQFLVDESLNGWDCIVYIYAERSEENSMFWSRNDELTYVKALCDVVENPKKLVAENLRNVEPYLIRAKYQYVFVLLDDCRLPSDREQFDLQDFLRVMEYNRLTVASPLVIGANKGGGQHFRKIMYTPAPSAYVGHTSVFVEIFAWVITVPAYQALWDLLCPHVNPYAWGYDIWYDRFAKRRVRGHKMGILSTARVYHEQNMTAVDSGRTDSTDAKVKWAAMKAQERFYAQRLHLHLHSFRMNNRSWNGAATGFLLPPPPPSSFSSTSP